MDNTRRAARPQPKIPYRFLQCSIAAFLAAGLNGCEKRPAMGYLRLEAPGAGSYEIYRISNDSPLQFVSEQAGQFNEKVALAPGSYLVLADCSSETVIIYPHKEKTLITHRLVFAPPRPPGPHDSFSIQCSRSDKTKSRQSIANRFELNVIHGKRDLLVGMVPMHIDFTSMPDPDKSKDLSYKLSALEVADFDGNVQDISYFVSPVDELIAATKYQQFGAWEFLLPGRYVVEVNGTRTQVDLREGEERIVKPALLTVTTSNQIDLARPAQIKGSPWLVEINTGHYLNFNETYPVLPGNGTIAISGSTQSIDLTFVEGETIRLKTRSVFVDSGCAEHDTSCLGDKPVSLYVPDEPYPFIESVSDIPILFVDQDKPILLGIEGSRDITYEIGADVQDKKISLGYVKLVPLPSYRPGQVTDLVRVEAGGHPFAGHSLDLNLEKTTVMPLIAGTYQLSHYVSITATEGDRRNTARNFTIEPGKTIEIEVPVFFSEKKFQAYRKKSPAPLHTESKPLEIGAPRNPAPPQAL